jgi:hypothetical protein
MVLAPIGEAQIKGAKFGVKRFMVFCLPDLILPMVLKGSSAIA